jgi:hypothetical protein
LESRETVRSQDLQRQYSFMDTDYHILLNNNWPNGEKRKVCKGFKAVLQCFVPSSFKPIFWLQDKVFLSNFQ